MPFLPRGTGAAPQENELSRGQWGRKARSSTLNKRERKIPGQAVEGEPSTLLAGDSGIYDRSPYSFLLDTSTKQVRFG
jgi:FixJ family two-component response regulator